jgi:3-deoxy-alpha-D-manno-octulosonate 8-oxidase
MVPRMMFAPGAVTQARSLVTLSGSEAPCVALIDRYFHGSGLAGRMQLHEDDLIEFVDASDEPTTDQIDVLCARIRESMPVAPAAIVGVGGGTVMDVAKALAVLFTNPGKAEDYQGWNLVGHPALYKIGIPTIAGTGAEVSRTAVLTGPVKKQGINSDFSLFDQIVLDPDLLATVPPRQRFYTGMDCYIHCAESLRGTFINDFARAFATSGLELCEDVFLHDAGDAQLMMASLLGGLSIGYSEVGVCHALSYGLSHQLGYHHGEANCIAFNVLEEYYPEHVDVFGTMLDRHGIRLPARVTASVPGDVLEKMVDVALTMDRALHNALGAEWRSRFSRERIRDLYSRM